MTALYTKTVWEDEVPVSTPVKYSITDDVAGEIAGSAVIAVETSVTAGTPINATNLNKIETGIYDNSVNIDANADAIDVLEADMLLTLPNAFTAAGMIALSDGVGSFDVLDAASNSGKAIISNGTTWVIVDRKWTLNITFGNGINAIQAATTMGNYIWVRVPMACSIVDWEISADAAGSAVIGVWKSTNLAGLTSMTGANSIAGTEKPTLSAQQTNSNATLSTWTPSLAEGNYLVFMVESAATVKKLALAIKGRFA